MDPELHRLLLSAHAAISNLQKHIVCMSEQQRQAVPRDDSINACDQSAYDLSHMLSDFYKSSWCMDDAYPHIARNAEKYNQATIHDPFCACDGPTGVRKDGNLGDIS